jgi:DNA topoisomerase-1
MKDTYILFLIESPGKIEKITHILNEKEEKYKVQASMGHIIDLDPKKMSIDFENNFTPIYIVKDEKKNVVSELKKSAKKAQSIILASDPDREGEGISWGIVTELNIKDYKRVTYNSITKDEILEALKNPRDLDMNLVHAQQMRRMLDRIIGYKLSPLIGKHLHNFHLSAGRVLSVIVELIIDKENEIKDFFQKEESSYFKFVGEFFEDKQKILKSNLFEKKEEKKNTEEVPKKKKKKTDTEETKDDTLTSKVAKISNGEEAKSLMDLMMKSKYIVGSTREHESYRYPSPPFSTSTLQQEASRKFGFQSVTTMMAAQHLYEAGLITYMRTDSINMSKEGIEKVGKFIVQEYGKEYHKETHYKAKTANTQESHECVRVVDPNIKEAKGKNISASEIRLYSLIWKRTVACQMAPAIFNVIAVNIEISKVKEYYFMARLEKLIFAGFLKVYNLVNAEKEDDEDENKISDVSIPKKGTELNVDNITATQEYNKPPSRYNVASLISQLDPSHLNIGRPSTYSIEIEHTKERNYVEIKDIEGFEKECAVMVWDSKDLKETTKKIMLGHETNKFVPTSLGMLVNDFLMKYFPDIMDYKFTAKMEENLDKIAEGKLDWIKVVKEFYDKFNPEVEKLMKIPEDKSFLDEHSRVIGKNPKTGLDMIATIAKYGPVVKMCQKTNKCVYAPIKKPLTIETITLEEALKLFDWPKSLGTYEGKQITLNKGQYGYYLKYSVDEKLALKLTEEELSTLDLEKATKLIEENNKRNLWFGKDSDNKYVVRNGQYGDYVSVKSLKKKTKAVNYKLPKDTVIKDLTLEKIQEIVKIAKSKKKTFRKKVPKTARTKTKKPNKVKKEKKLSKKELNEIFND